MDDKILEKIVKGRQYRNMLEIRAKDDAEEMIVEGYASTFNDPYILYKFDNYTVREQIDPHAFDECDMSDVIFQYDHQGRVFARTSNGTLEVKTDAHGLFVRANLGGTEMGRNLYGEIKGGYTTKMSFGFIVGEDKREITENKETGEIDVLRTITKVSKLFDVSSVSLPANDSTEISARSFVDGVIAELEAERLNAEKRRRQKARIKMLGAI